MSWDESLLSSSDSGVPSLADLEDEEERFRLADEEAERLAEQEEDNDV